MSQLEKRRIYFRADGNNTIGAGHIYRLIALTQILKDDFDCVFVTNKPDPGVLNEIEKSCQQHIILNTDYDYSFPDKIKPGDELPFDLGVYLKGNEIVVTDGYLFGTEYQKSIKSKGAKLVCIDDLATMNFYADVVINHAPGIDKSIYKTQKYTEVYTGLDYAIIRPPFFAEFAEKVKQENAFLSLGGADYFEHTKKMLDLLLQIGKFKTIHVLSSSSFSLSLLKYLNEAERENSGIKLHFNLNAEQLIDTFDYCTYAFVSASTILIETYSRGLKCIAGYYSKNQKFIYDGFVRENYAIGSGDFNSIDYQIIEDAINKQPEYRTKPLHSYQKLNEIFLAL